eukprot:m.183957 g.183957  ORF g.183957 m.183957 type:complete len:226 (+) comp16900_c0_seq5:62-739(+)
MALMIVLLNQEGIHMLNQKQRRMTDSRGVPTSLIADIIVPEDSAIVAGRGLPMREAFRLPNRQLDVYIQRKRIKNGPRFKTKFVIARTASEQDSIVGLEPEVVASMTVTYNDAEVKERATLMHGFRESRCILRACLANELHVGKIVCRTSQPGCRYKLGRTSMRLLKDDGTLSEARSVPFHVDIITDAGGTVKQVGLESCFVSESSRAMHSVLTITVNLVTSSHL